MGVVINFPLNRVRVSKPSIIIFASLNLKACRGWSIMLWRLMKLQELNQARKLS